MVLKKMNLRDGVDDRIQGCTGAHRLFRLYGIRLIIAAEILGFALSADQFFIDLGLIFLQLLCYLGKACGKIRIFGLFGCSLWHSSVSSDR